MEGGRLLLGLDQFHLLGFLGGGFEASGGSLSGVVGSRLCRGLGGRNRNGRGSSGRNHPHGFGGGRRRRIRDRRGSGFPELLGSYDRRMLDLGGFRFPFEPSQ